ncbi:hypothetical protein EIB18_02395 [Caulobacter vibrioides]|uniref:Uncharacterized protein n=1 Tax=Caulobacter vibrioides (strain NA1000 / CB15N) TaxID=565050 RepID=A0A0H3C6X9_CAUVN|nr:hypothetical protein [Caulobacter vibrioides]YP_002515846.1 hypothetical protein CCNA_00473 [Caulobacter vibrioides NA1000]ACL93938.1 hypothetical protein CCNA_00473 [Caulobacter vibrioides NA1000]ATC27290.1 hypothetical protein CA607_02385 [Caulobacter vibrioides]AZH11672.1 hypothetical protein EIB18_02395 [Caulobacter vibrioides]
MRHRRSGPCARWRWRGNRLVRPHADAGAGFEAPSPADWVGAHNDGVAERQCIRLHIRARQGATTRLANKVTLRSRLTPICSPLPATIERNEAYEAAGQSTEPAGPSPTTDQPINHLKGHRTNTNQKAKCSCNESIKNLVRAQYRAKGDIASVVTARSTYSLSDP